MEHVQLNRKESKSIQGITSENLHYWWNLNETQFLVSNENNTSKNKITLYQFDRVEAAINYLFLNGFKQSAREINKHESETYD